MGNETEKFTKEKIEQFYKETMEGLYLSQCAKNGGVDEKGFYKNQLDTFTNGFEICLLKMKANL